MTTLNEKLAKVMAIKDETEMVRSLEEFCRSHFEDLPLPGESSYAIIHATGEHPVLKAGSHSDWITTKP